MSRTPRVPVRAAAGVAVVSLLGLVLWANQASPEVPAEAPAVHQKAKKKASKRQSDVTVRRQAPPPAEVSHALPAAPVAEAAEPAEPTDIASLIVDVVDENGRPDDDAWVVPVDCPGWDYGAEKGEYRAEPGRCVLQAASRDGALQQKGVPVTIELSLGEPAYVQLELPEIRRGGIGIRFRPTEEGVRVTSVSPGTPAFAAGIEPGDLIVAVQGEDVLNLDSDEFIDRMTGAVGTDVEFTVGIESDTGLTEETVRVTRAFLDI